MNNLLRYMIHLVDFMRENNIVWGVGRGSSVARYVLYLIGVHTNTIPSQYGPGLARVPLDKYNYNKEKTMP